VLRFSIAQTLIFGFSTASSMIAKIVVCAVKNLSAPLDRARRVMLGTGS